MTTQFSGEVCCPICSSNLDLIKDFQTDKWFALAARKKVNIVQHDDKIDASQKHNPNETNVETNQIRKQINQFSKLSL